MKCDWVIDFENGTFESDSLSIRINWENGKEMSEEWCWYNDSGGGSITPSRLGAPRLMLADVITQLTRGSLDDALAQIDARADRIEGELCRCGSTEVIRRRVGPHLGRYCYRCNKWFTWEAAPLTLENAKNFVMPFGKHKGQRLDDLSDDYLDWLYENCDKGKIPEMARLVFEARQ